MTENMEGRVSRRGLEYLNSLPKWSGNGAFTLEHISRFLSKVGAPNSAFPTVLVAGSNGKGSTSTVLSTMLAISGRRVGLYTSPHLVSPRERISINRLPIEMEEMGLYAYEISRVCGDEILLSHFEAMTAIAFMYFRDQRVDIGVFECGLGGRLDAVNCARDVVCSCITTVSLEHTHILGDNIRDIAKEKAGILRSDSTAIIGEVPQEGCEAIEGEARKRGDVVILKYGRDFRGEMVEGELISIHDSKGEELKARPSLRGMHQMCNLSCANEIGLVLGLDNESRRRGIEEAVLRGRLEVIEIFGRRVVIDCAHNPEGTLALYNYLKSQGFRDLAVIFGALETKDWREMISILSPLITVWMVCEPDSTAAVSSEELCKELLEKSRGEVIALGRDYNRALKLGLKEVKEGRDLLCCGSIYLIGEVLKALDAVIEAGTKAHMC